MSFLSRLFGSKARSKEEDVEVRLAHLEKEAEKAKPGYVGSALNRAGDLALKSDQHDRAVAFYGRAIDAFLDDAQRESARGVANKIIRVRPTAIRTLCTITWLDLAARHQASALMHLRDYVSAADEANQQARAATQIHYMAATSRDSEFIDAVADALDALDYPLRAKQVRSWVTTGAPAALDDALALSDACMKAAISSNDADVPLLLDGPVAGEVPESDDASEMVADSEAEPQEPMEEAEATPVASDAEAESASEAATIEEAEPESIDAEGFEPGPEANEASDSPPESGAAADESEKPSRKAGKSGKSGKRGKSKKKRKKKRKG